ncbi:MAG: glycosyl transferase family 90 [Chlamydiota bacterium]
MKALWIICFMAVVVVQLHGVNHRVLSEKLSATPPEWMVKQITKDLEFFQDTGVTKEALDLTTEKLNKVSLAFRCKVFQNTIEFHHCFSGNQVDFYQTPDLYNHPRFQSVHYVLKYLAKHYSLPDLDFIISLEDSLDEEMPAPVMTFAKNKHIKTSVAFPDFEAILGYKKLIKKVLVANYHFAFDEKIGLAFWRGATTGGAFTIHNWEKYPRSSLVLFANQHPNILDAKYTSVVSDSDQSLLEKLFQEKNLLGSSTSIYDHIQYKYLIDIDGNSCTYSRLFWILLSNSLCIKQISDNEQWYYGALKPYVHYLPFKTDMSDLAIQIAWAEKHPNEVKQMIYQANCFVKKHLLQEHVFQYVYLLLNAYAKLQKVE